MSEHDSTCVYPAFPVLAVAVEWSLIEGFPGYCVGSDGSVWSCRKRRKRSSAGGFVWVVGDGWRRMKLSQRAGYPVVEICNNKTRRRVYVHRLILESFVGPCPDGMESCHNDSKRDNCTLENLRWDTRAANIQDMRDANNVKRGESSNLSRLTEKEVLAIRELSRRGFTSVRIARWYGIHKVTARNIIRRRAWTHI